MIMKQMARAGKDSADKELQGTGCSIVLLSYVLTRARCTVSTAKAAAAQREQVALKTQRSKAKAAKARVRKAQDGA